MSEIKVEEVIVDLYEMRASVLVPAQAGQMEKVQNVFQYDFISAIIKKLIDKYQVRGEDIENVICERGKIEALKK